MKPQSFFRFVIFTALLSLLAACANVVTPDGGPRDTLPPVITAALPASGAVSFSSKEIELRFNEYIQLKEVGKNVLISPPVSKMPDFRLRGKSLKIVFRDTLKPNTTYCLNFGGAITDLNEGNVLSGYQYLFSTGPFRDSLTTGGRVLNAFTLAPEPDVLVMLYKQNLDSLPYKTIPDFIARTGSDGVFTLSALPAGNYKMVALRDKEGDLRFSQPSEDIAFLDSLVVPVPRDTGKKAAIKLKYELLLFKEELKKIHVLGKSSDPTGSFRIAFNRRADSVTVQPLKNFPDACLLTQWNRNRDTLSGWLNHCKTDTLDLRVKGPTGLCDTVEIVFVRPAKMMRPGKGEGPPKFSYKCNASSGFIEKDQPLSILFSNPLDSVKTERLKLTEDGTEAAYRMTYTDALKKEILLTYPWKEGKRYRLLAGPGTFTDLLGLKNDSVRVAFTLRSPKDFGLLRVTASMVKPGYILQLLSEKGELLREQTGDGKNTFVFEKLLPGKYSLKIIADTNGDGIWNTGDYLKKKQPERVFLYGKPVVVKADWETEVSW